MRTLGKLIVLCCYCLSMFGCAEPENDPPFWEKIKLKDLAPSGTESSELTQPLKGMTIDIHHYEVARDKLKDVNNLWNPLNQQAIRFHHPSSFTSNGFKIARGTLQHWNWVTGMLDRVQAQKVQVVSMLLTQEYEHDMIIKPIAGRRAVSFLDGNGQTQSSVMGPGFLTLHVEVEKPRSAPYPTHITAYPMFTVPGPKSIEPLARQADNRRISFEAAGFTAHMMPGQILVLGPETYFGDESTLGGLFFSNPSGRRFGPSQEQVTPVIKPTVRILVIMCTRVQ